MIYVKLSDALERFIRYLKDCDSDLISKDQAIEELKDALDSAEFQEIEE